METSWGRGAGSARAWRRLAAFFVAVSLATMGACSGEGGDLPPSSTESPQGPSSSAQRAHAKTAGPVSSGEWGPNAPRLRVVGQDLLPPNSSEPIWLRGYNWGWWDTAQEKDAAANVKRGANIIRMPFRWYFSGKKSDIRETKAPGHISPEGLVKLDQFIDWAADEGLWVVLFAGSDLGAGDSDDNYWTNPALRKEFFETWAFLAERYKNHPQIAAYELLSEPHPKKPYTSKDLHSFYDDLIDVIREHDTQTPVMIGPNDHYDIRLLEEAYTKSDSKVIYTTNFYLPTEYCKPNNRGDQNPDLITYPGTYIDRDGKKQKLNANKLAEELQPAIDFRSHRDAPVLVGQIGCVGEAPGLLDYTADALDLMRQEQFHWTFWTYRTTEKTNKEHGIWYYPNNKWKMKKDLDQVVKDGLKP